MKNQQPMKYLLFSIICLLLASPVIAENMQEPKHNDNYIQLQTNHKKTFSAYVVGPENAKKAVLLIHGWWGLTWNVENWANQFAANGYRVMAIDLYNKKTTKHATQARKLMSAVDQSVANEQYQAAIRALSAPGRKIAVVGRSYGGTQALYAASVAQDKIAAAIIYYPYGDVIAEKQTLSLIKAPVLGHFASDDFFLTPDKLNDFKSTVKESGVNMTSQTYEARHGFDNPYGQNYQAQSGQLAMERTYQFLDQYLN